jgi:uncharacterized protein
MSRSRSDPQRVVNIIVAGAAGVGKSAFVRSLSDVEVVSTRRAATDETRLLKIETTVVVDWGRLTVASDLVAHLFAMPGRRRFDLLWEILAGGPLGLIALVDSTRPDTFRETIEIIEFFQHLRPMPYVIAATKQDHPAAWSPDELRPALRLPHHVTVLPCVSTDRDRCTQITLDLLDQVLAPVTS